VSLEQDELLAQESVFEYQFRLAAGKVQDGIEGKGLIVQHCPTTETLLDIAAQSIQSSADEGRDPESRNISVSWLLHDNPKGLLVLVG